MFLSIRNPMKIKLIDKMHFLLLKSNMAAFQIEIFKNVTALSTHLRSFHLKMCIDF